MLLTTDVACRGLDVPRVAWVVQYHVPGKPVDYVHRVGRTARAGGSGKALLFLQPEENDYLRVLQGLGVQTEPLPMGDLLQAALVHANNVRRKKVRRTLSRGAWITSTCLCFSFDFRNHSYPLPQAVHAVGLELFFVTTRCLCSLPHCLLLDNALFFFFALDEFWI